MRFAPEYSELRKRSRDLIGSRRLASPEGARSLVGEGLRQIGEHGAVARLNEGLDRHAGDQAQTAEARELLLGERNPHRVIARAGALVSSEIAGNPRDLPIQLGRSALVEGGEAQHGVLPDPDLIDVLRVELRLDRQLIRWGTITMIASPATITPPTVCTVDWWTMPSWGARMSIRLS